MDLTTQYLGLQLKSPLVPSASPLSKRLDTIRRLEDAGIAAVVLPSLFSRMPVRPGTRFKSTMYLGRSPFSFIAMTKSVPPARKRPPGPWSSRSRLASWRFVG